MITGKSTKLPLVALMGIDGSGKSSVLHVLRTQYIPSLNAELVVLHRGKVTRNFQIDHKAFDHHAERPYPWLISVLKLFVKALDWLKTYWTHLASLRYKGYLVVTDRFYFHDLVIDPLRYRYNGPFWLVEFITRLLPKPDLYIFLDAPADVLIERKKEIPAEEINRQRAANLKLIKSLPKGYVVDACQPLERVAADTWQIISNYQSSDGV